MKTKTKINKAKNKFIFCPHDNTCSTNKIYKTNNTSSNIMSSKDLFNNDIKTEYRSSFIYKTINNDFSLKNNISSRNNFKLRDKKKKLSSNGLKIEKLPTRLIKEIKLNLQNDSINNNIINKKIKNNSNQKFDFIKKKFLNKIKESNIFILSNSKEEKISKLSQNINNSKYHDYNTSRCFHNEKLNSNSKNNNSCKNNEIKNICQIEIFRNDRKSCNNINFRFNIKTDLDSFKPIESKNYRKIKFNTLDTKLMISPRRESDQINKWNRLKKSENKKPRKNKELSDININDNDLKMITKKRTFVEKDIPFKFNCFCTSKNTIDVITHNKREYYPYFIESCRKTMTKYITNKRRILIKNNKSVKSGNYSDSNMVKKSSKSNAVLDAPKKEKNIIESKKSQKLDKILLSKNNNTNKNNFIKNNKKMKISKKESKKIERENLEEQKISNSNKIKKVNILKMKPSSIRKKSESDNKIKYIHEKQNNDNDNLNDEELNYVFDIESEHKNAINIIKTNNFEVNKQKENNMKYTLLKEFEDEEDIKNVNKSQIENIIIGKIEGYRDIIESDELNKKLQLRSKSSFDIHKQTHKKIESQPQKLIKKTKNKEKYKNLNNLSNKKSPFLNMHILDDNSSEIEDLDFDSNEQLLNIEKEYEFEDMTTYENETKTNNDTNLLPFRVSKISFCKFYDKNDGQYKTNENIDTDMISLVQISKELNKLNDKYKIKKRTTLNINSDFTKNKIIKNKIINFKKTNNKKDCNIVKKPIKKNSFKKHINNNITNSLNYQNSIKNNKNPFLRTNNIISINNINYKCDFMKNKIINYNKNSENVKRKKVKQKKLYISNKNKNDNLKIVSNYGNKDNCLVF